MCRHYKRQGQIPGTRPVTTLSFSYALCGGIPWDIMILWGLGMLTSRFAGLHHALSCCAAIVHNNQWINCKRKHFITTLLGWITVKRFILPWRSNAVSAVIRIVQDPLWSAFCKFLLRMSEGKPWYWLKLWASSQSITNGLKFLVVTTYSYKVQYIQWIKV